MTTLMAHEEVIFSEGPFFVSNTRFMVGSRTHAMSAIISVRQAEESAPLAPPMLLTIIGTLVAGYGFTFGQILVILLGILVGIVGVWWWLRVKPTYRAVLVLSNWEDTVLSSHDQKEVARLVTALNEGLVAHRSRAVWCHH